MEENIGDLKLRFLSFLKSYHKCQREDFRNIHGEVENQKKCLVSTKTTCTPPQTQRALPAKIYPQLPCLCDVTHS